MVCNKTHVVLNFHWKYYKEQERASPLPSEVSQKNEMTKGRLIGKMALKFISVHETESEWLPKVSVKTQYYMALFKEGRVI